MTGEIPANTPWGCAGDRLAPIPAKPKERKHIMSKKLMIFASRKVAAFLAGLLTGIVVGGCSVFGPGIGASVY